MAQVKDPVCGMTVDSENTPWQSVYKGNKHYFCAPGCKTAFDANPETYLKEPSAHHHGKHHHKHHGHS